MDITFFDSDIFKWVILPLLIFLSRMCDVTLGTLRNVFIGKGLRRVVPLMAFFEVLIWLISVRQVMNHLNNPICYIAFAGGYAMGTYVGLRIERRLALGLQVMRIITNQESTMLVNALREAKFGVTLIDGHGARGPVKILLTVIKRKDFELVAGLIKKHSPQAFYSIEDIRAASAGGVFPSLKAKNGSMDYIRSVLPQDEKQ